MSMKTSNLPDIVGEINRKYPGSLLKGSDPSLTVQRISSGLLSIDYLLGGGFPRGRSVEVFGSYSVGKSAIAFQLMAQCQALGEQVCYLDCEHTYDPTFAAAQGVDPDQVTYHEQESGNRVVDLMELLLRSREYGVLVLDSIAALIPKQELENDMEAGSMGMEQAKLMSKALRKLTTANSNTVLYFINQTRQAVGVVFGKQSTTSGGRAMGFYATTRLELVRTETIKRKGSVIDPAKGDAQQKDIPVGHRVLVRVDKNKGGGGSKQGDQTTCVFDYTQKTFDHLEDLLYLGLVIGAVKKSGTKWSVPELDDEVYQGRTRFKAALKRDEAIQQELESRIRAAIATKGVDEETLEEDEGEE